MPEINDHDTSNALSETRREILTLLKTIGGATQGEIANHLKISGEGARQHLSYLESQGWVCRQTQRPTVPTPGRPVIRYEITEAGDHLFPKRYDELSIALIDTVLEHYGQEALKKVLTAIVDQQVQAWEPRLQGKSLRERIDLLKGFYFEDDPFTTVEEEDGGLVLIERNCPFRNVAMKRPQLCSTTVSTLMRVLGVKVERREKFQLGDGRCAFHVLKDQPIDPATFRFSLEAASDENL